MSVNTGGWTGGNGWSGNPVISADGNVVAFTSLARDLDSEWRHRDTNSQHDVFARNMTTGETHLVSVSLWGLASGNGGSYNPVISADGNVVAFFSSASDLHDLDTNTGPDVFARNLVTGETHLVSVNLAGTASGNDDSHSPVISADGKVVAFTSYASDLHVLDTNGWLNVFARNLVTGETQLVSVNSAGTASGNDDSYSPVISADGKVVAFHSLANDLHALDVYMRFQTDVFARNLVTGETHLVSVNSAGTASGNSSSSAPAISADGNVIAFSSYARDLHDLDTNTGLDVFARNLVTGETHLISVSLTGTASGNGSSSSPVISADGNTIAFYSGASDLHALDTDSGPDVFARNLVTGETHLISVNLAGTASGNGSSYNGAISADGTTVAFRSNSDNLVSGDTNGKYDVFISTVPAETTPLNPVLTVDILDDEFDHDFDPGDLSFREAIWLASLYGSAWNTIEFAPQLFASGPVTIAWGTVVQPRILNSLRINGPGADLLTIRAYNPTPGVHNGDGSRVLLVDDGVAAAQISVEIRGLTLTGGDPSGSGGAIASGEILKLVDCVVTGNYSIGHGGAIYSSGTLELVRTTVSNNSAGSTSFSAKGGGIWNAGTLIVRESTISGNQALGANGSGGGIANVNGGDAVSISGATIANNRAYSGAGISSVNTSGASVLNISNSTITLNETQGSGSLEAGGAMYLDHQGSVFIRFCTITDNSSFSGGGIVTRFNPSTRLEILSSIVAGNTNRDFDAFFGVGPNLVVSLGSNIVGNGIAALMATFSTSKGDLIGVDPALGPLVDNGGPTWTRAPLPGSPAIDAGQILIGPWPNDRPLWDQRGQPFGRGHGSRIDIGAFETGPVPAAFYGDYNQNGSTDAADYSVWRDMLGATGIVPYSGADGDGDGSVNPGDLEVWKANFGWVAGSGGSGGGAALGIVELEANFQVESALPPAEPGAEGRAPGAILLAGSTEHPPAPPGVWWSLERGVDSGAANANSRGKFWRPKREHFEAVADRALVAWVAERASDRGSDREIVELAVRDERTGEAESAPADDVFTAFGVRRAIDR